MTKYRIKTKAEFEATQEKDRYDDYKCGKTVFNTRDMAHLYGFELTDSAAQKIIDIGYNDNISIVLENGSGDKDYNWNFNAHMITPIEFELPENWYLVIDRSNYEDAENWRQTKCDIKWSYKIDLVDNILLSKHLHDDSYYYCRSLHKFKEDSKYKDYKEITTEQFRQHVLKQTQTSKAVEKTQTITREAFTSIYDVACSTWKKKLEDMVKSQNFFAKEIVLSQKDVSDMFDASDASQIKVLEKAGLRRAKHGIKAMEDMKVGELCSIFSGHDEAFGHIVLRIYGDRVVSLNNPTITWTDITSNTIEVEELDSDYKYTITNKKD